MTKKYIGPAFSVLLCYNPNIIRFRLKNTLVILIWKSQLCGYLYHPKNYAAILITQKFISQLIHLEALI